MFSTKVLPVFSPIGLQVRNMATLKDISMRLKSVKNIQKITQSMKMVSAAKYNRAERELRSARTYGHGARAFYDKAEVAQEADKPNHLLVAMTSDRGLCGATHSNIVRMIRIYMAENKDKANIKLIAVGDKSKAMLSRQYKENMLVSVNDVGKKPPTFDNASQLAAIILDSGFEFDFGQLYYNVFKSVVSYRTSTLPLFTLDQVSRAEHLPMYDSLDEETLRCYNEFSTTSLIYYAMKEGACSEQSSRMTAMDGASKNAGEMIEKLTLTYNRTRQAVITKELIEIISGAACVSG